MFWKTELEWKTRFSHFPFAITDWENPRYFCENFLQKGDKKLIKISVENSHTAKSVRRKKIERIEKKKKICVRLRWRKNEFYFRLKFKLLLRNILYQLASMINCLVNYSRKVWSFFQKKWKFLCINTCYQEEVLKNWIF